MKRDDEEAGYFALLTAAVAALLLLILAAAAHARPPENADPALAPWFQSLRQPETGAGCCSIADCRATDYRQTPDGFEAFIDKKLFPIEESVWMKVPPERVLQRTENPTGRAVVCFTPYAGILCFVRPAET